MRVAAGRLLSLCAILLAAIVVQAQNPPADPRVGLKPGFRDAGEARRHMERVASLPKPEGFFDPKAPAGAPTAPERAAPAGRGAAPAGTANGGAAGQAGASAAPAPAAEAADENGTACVVMAIVSATTGAAYECVKYADDSVGIPSKSRVGRAASVRLFQPTCGTFTSPSILKH